MDKVLKFPPQVEPEPQWTPEEWETVSKMLDMMGPPPAPPVSIPRIIKLRDKMFGVVYLDDHRKQPPSC